MGRVRLRVRDIDYTDHNDKQLKPETFEGIDLNEIELIGVAQNGPAKGISNLVSPQKKEKSSYNNNRNPLITEEDERHGGQTNLTQKSEDEAVCKICWGTEAEDREAQM